MQTIKVSKKEIVAGGKVVALYDDKDIRYSGFLPALKDVNEGDTVKAEIEITKKGDKTYNNITSFEVTEKAVPQSQQAEKTINHTESVKMEVVARARNTALMQAVEVEKIRGNFDNVLPLASEFARWLIHGEIKPSEKPEPPKSNSYVTDPASLSAWLVSDLRKLQIASKDEFYKAALKYLNLPMVKVTKEVFSFNLDDPEQRKAAWFTLVGLYNGKPPIPNK